MHEFSVELQAQGNGVFVEVPLDVSAVFGRKRVPVRGTVNSTDFRSTIAVYGGGYYLPMRRSLRERAGISAGDMVTIAIELDDAPRAVEVPAALADALESAGLRDEFDRLSYSHRKEHVDAILEAKREETRERRIAKALEMLGDGDERA